MDSITLTTGEIRFDMLLETLSAIVWNSSHHSCGVNREVGVGVIPRGPAGAANQLFEPIPRCDDRSVNLCRV